MKKIFFILFAFVFTISAYAQQVSKQTMLYSVKDADSLYLDSYSVGRDNVSAEKRPCVIFVFGGGFVTGTRDAEHYVPYFNYLAEKGFVVIPIDYRLGLKKAVESGQLSPDTFGPAFMQTLFMAVDDLYDATLYLLSNADRLNIDKDKIVTMGSSAGAITVLMGEYYLCNGNMLAKKLPVGFNYAGIVSLAGAIFDIGNDLTWKSQPAPIMLFHGDADANVPYDVVRDSGVGFFGSKYIAEQLTAMKAPHYFYSEANASHRLAVKPMDDNRYEIDAFFQKLVFGKKQLVINTSVTPLDKQEAKKDFTLMDYIMSNFKQ